jgi:hypothetical protein
VSEFASRAFGRRFRSALEVVPPRFTLAPGEQRDVTLHLRLDPSLFAAGADYVATLQISGAGERDLIVQLLARVEPLADTHPGGDAARSSAHGKTADKPQPDGLAETVEEEPVAAVSRRPKSSPTQRKRS